VIAFLTDDLVRAFAGGGEIELMPLVQSGPYNFTTHVREIAAMAQVANIIVALALLVVLLGLWSQITRFRRGSSLERQQIKWAIFALLIWSGALPLAVLPLDIPFSSIAFIAPIIPLGIAIPILRYRLYDIDIIINRTLVYGLLTAALAGVYYLSVVALEQVVRAVTGGQSPLAIVASTLMIAALFFPLRRRIQDFIDRRFYRRKYDAARILARFAATSRANADLDSLRAEMLAVVEQTMQPRSAALWLKPGEEPAGSGEAE